MEFGVVLALAAPAARLGAGPVLPDAPQNAADLIVRIVARPGGKARGL